MWILKNRFLAFLSAFLILMAVFGTGIVAAEDSTTDTSTDAASDTSTDAASDTSSDAVSDTSTDAPSDTSTDDSSSSENSVDDSSTTDSGTDDSATEEESSSDNNVEDVTVEESPDISEEAADNAEDSTDGEPAARSGAVVAEDDSNSADDGSTVTDIDETINDEDLKSADDGSTVIDSGGYVEYNEKNNEISDNDTTITDTTTIINDDDMTSTDDDTITANNSTIYKDVSIYDDDSKTNITHIETKNINIDNSQNTKVSFEDNSVVNNINFVSKDSGKTKVIVKEVYDKPPVENVYKTFNIWIDNAEVNSKIENAAVDFKVEKTWLIENNLDSSAIILNMYENHKWVEVPVTIKGEDSKYVYFSAKVSKYSTFAISSNTVTVDKVLKHTGTTASDPEEEIGEPTKNVVIKMLEFVIELLEGK